MKLRVSVHMHIRDNTPANARLNAFAEGLGNQDGVFVQKIMRTQLDLKADLVVVKGLSASKPLRWAVENRVPYIILEEPYWRPSQDFILLNTSYAYNGYAGMGFYPATPDEERLKPKLRPWKHSGSTVIFGQKPDDYSLRGHDHIQWIKDKQEQYPGAELRHHPLMMPGKENPESLISVLDRTHRAITYTSTVGAEALIYGCESRPEGAGSSAYGVKGRHEWLHAMSWRQFSNGELGQVEAVKHILSAYDEARERAKGGLVETPRDKVVRGINEGSYRDNFQ